MCLLRGGGLYTKILSLASGITRLILTTRAAFHFHLSHDLPQNQCPHLLLQQPPKKQLEPNPDKDIGGSAGVGVSWKKARLGFSKKAGILGCQIRGLTVLLVGRKIYLKARGAFCGLF
ncbi:hypothetical protein L2E82_49262 [Cichorium intybus]|uniref:Uncharacterized protein n=1 Tax=Cichorium intybus TaxID=13427 RepID=A0ACB8Z0A7_CICIN|nr:hypothetical protein L2E82_49262 [Cichorium intybus]